MVTKESLLQEVVEAYRTYGAEISADYTEEEFAEGLGKTQFWDAFSGVRHIFLQHLDFLRMWNVNNVEIYNLICQIAREYATPLQSYSGQDMINIYRHSKVLLPNENLYRRDLCAFVHRETEVDVVDTYTGEVIPPDTPMVYYDEGFTMVSNLNERFYVCMDCERLLCEDEMDCFGDRRRVCEECYDSGRWSICEHCGEPVDEDDAISVTTCHGDEYWCPDCRDREAHYCDCCGEYYSDDYDFTYTDDGNYVCDSCLSDNYTQCEECGDWIYNDDVYWDDDDTPLCRHCYRNLHGRLPNEYERVIDSYHTHHNNYNMTFGESNKRSGLELEVEGSSKTSKELNEMAKELIEMATDENGNSHIYCENDGSLCSGFEIITNPHTPEELFKLPIREMLQKLIDNGYTSHNNGRCGLHIHFSNEWFGDDYDEIDDNVAKVVHFYSENYDTMFKLSRRTSGSAESWARRFAVDDFEDSKVMKGSSTGHGTAVNLGNMNTIHTVEFRLGRGTLLFESFMAWIDIHLAIVRNVRNIEKNDTDINKWLAGVSEATKEYIRNRAGIEIVDAEREVA